MALMLGIALGKAVVMLFVVFFLGKRLLSKWFFIVARGKSAELFVLNVLLITLGLAWLTEAAGLSLALGAFLAGMLISEPSTGIRWRRTSKPFRDILMGLFFVTVGMMLDLSLVFSNMLLVLAILVALLVVKFALVFGLSRLFGSFSGAAMRSGLWLCAGGEFGFVLLSEIKRMGAVPPPLRRCWRRWSSPCFWRRSSSTSAIARCCALPREWLMRSMQLNYTAALDEHR